MLSNEKMLTLLTKTTESSARLAGTKRNIHELFDDLTLTVETKKPKTSWLRHVRHIASFLDPDDRRKLALTSHDAHRVIASA